MFPVGAECSLDWLAVLLILSESASSLASTVAQML